MKRATTVPPAARAAFLAVLSSKPHGAALPDPLPLNKVLQLSDKASRSTDTLRVLAGHDDTGYFLDYYRIYNDGETSWHARIREDGSVESLENIEGQLGRTVFPDPADTERERQRLIAHNARVHELLKKKRFL